jgi:hypothetical protein
MKKELKGYDLIIDRVTEIYATLNVAHGILRELMQSGALKEDRRISRKLFPKGGLKLVDENMIKAYKAVQAALIEHERLKK